MDNNAQLKNLHKKVTYNYPIDDDKYGYEIEDEDDVFLMNVFEEDNEENDDYDDNLN